jgi:hypothetical protein
VLAGSAPGAPALGSLIQGPARGPFASLAPTGTASAATLPGGAVLTSAYLGDVALAAPVAVGGRSSVAIRIERWFARSLGPVELAGAARGAIRSLVLALDYRTDSLAAWQQGGAIYSREIAASGAVGPLQRIAACPGAAHLSALISDDDHGILAWSERRAGITSVYLDVSAAGVRFAAPRLLERYGEAPGEPPVPSSPQLVRLRSEAVMIAWEGRAQGRRVVRAAAVGLGGPGAVATETPDAASATSGDEALLAGLAPGPEGDALALWTQPLAGGAGAGTATGPTAAGDQELFAARVHQAFPGAVTFAGAERVAAPGRVADATVAFDPASGRALAAWRGAGGVPLYALRAAPGAVSSSAGGRARGVRSPR